MHLWEAGDRSQGEALEAWVGQAAAPVGGRQEVWVPKAKILPAIKSAHGLGSVEGTAGCDVGLAGS